VLTEFALDGIINELFRNSDSLSLTVAVTCVQHSGGPGLKYRFIQDMH